MEVTGHYWMVCYSFLVARSYSVAVINPMQVKAVRTLKGLDKVKNDRIDAGLIAETLHIRPVRRDQARHRRGGVAKVAVALPAVAAGHARRVQDPVHMPDGHPFPGIYGHILRHVQGGQPRGALRVAAALRAGTQACRFAHARHRRGKSAEYAAEIKAAAKSSISVRLGQKSASFQIKSLIRQIEFADSECAKVEARLQALLDEVEPLVLTIPGVSYVTGAQIVSEIGDVSRPCW